MSDRRTPEDVVAIQHAVDSAQVEGMPTNEWLEWDLAFHTAISKATKNPLLELSMISLHQSRSATNTVFVGLLDRPTVLRQHQQIADAIQNMEPEAAKAALLTHVDYLDEVRRSALTALEVDDVPVSQLLIPSDPIPRGALPQASTPNQRPGGGLNQRNFHLENCPPK